MVQGVTILATTCSSPTRARPTPSTGAIDGKLLVGKGVWLVSFS